MPAGLITLSVVPAVAGAIRVTELTSGARVTPDNARFFDAPVPVLVHIVGATVYCVLGAFQFVPGHRRSGRHRVIGRVIVPCGLVTAMSGVWMTLFYPLPAGDGGLLTVFRLVFGSAMAVAIALGFAAVRRRDFGTHRVWMVRGYAIGLGAGTQVVTLGLWTASAGMPGELARALLMGAGWVINLAVAERFVRKTPVREEIR